MYMVYWTVSEGSGHTPHSQAFPSSDMRPAMELMEQLRARQRAGEGIGFVVMSSENPESVGHPGVDTTGPGYKWTKRRHRF
jgi:hypothetical protein